VSDSMEKKLDKVIEIQTEMQLDLREHMHRTQYNEDRIEKLEDTSLGTIRRIHDKLESKVETKLFFLGAGRVYDVGDALYSHR